MGRLLRILLFALLLAAPQAEAAPPRQKARTTKTAKSKKTAKKEAAPKTSADAKRRRQQTRQQMERTARELKEAERTLGANLRKVSTLEAEIDRTASTSTLLKTRIDSIVARATTVKDSITAGEAELARLRELYTRAVRSSRRNRREMNSLTFIFSAETFRQAWRRMRYLEQYSKWRERKTAQINDVVARLEGQKEELEQMKVRLTNLRTESLAHERKLRNDRAELQTAVGSLQGKQKELNAMLQRQKSTLDRLDAEIERLILKEAEEQRRREEEAARRRADEEARRKAAEAERKAAEASEMARKVLGDDSKKSKTKPAKPAETPKPKSDFKPGATAENSPGNFAAQKGKLPSPLSHTYVVVQGFGVQKHRSISTLEVNNPGVDLETAASATARAVYPGVVSAVFLQDGLGHVVLVRHGEYLTVYANVRVLSVKKGQKLKTGDVIGTVGASDVNPTRGLLHFEIRREREKFDPRLWLKR